MGDDFRHIQHPKKRIFLDSYIRTGTITYAARAAEIDRTTHYNWLGTDLEYEKAFSQAREAAIDELESEARKRAFDGSDVLLIFLMKGAMPDKYADRHRTEISGRDGKPIQIQAMTDVQLLAVIREDSVPAVTSGVGALPPPTGKNGTPPVH